jgi:16S rRNA (guanine966-N2)-methyltransferase
VVFLDPPYDVADDSLREILLTLLANRWLTADVLVTVERGTRGGTFGWPEGFEGLRSRRYGEATLWYGRAAQVTRGS